MILAIWYLSGVALTLWHGLWLVVRLAEPEDGLALGKLRYADLVAPRRVAALLLMALAAQVATCLAPAPERGLWLVYGSAIAALVWVDACTTWLPATLTWLVTGELAVAAIVSWWLSAERATLGAHLVLGAAAAFIMWWLLWRISRGGVGFGDVRLAPLVGALAGTAGISGWFAGMIAGSAFGVVWGLTVGKRFPAPGTTRGFAYGPALWAGAFASLAYGTLSAG